MMKNEGKEEESAGGKQGRDASKAKQEDRDKARES